MHAIPQSLFLLPAVLVGMNTASAALVFFDDFESYTPGTASDDATYAVNYTNTSESISVDSGTGLGGGQAWNIGGDNQIRRNISVDLVNGADKTAVSSIFFQWAGSSAIATAQIGFTTPAGNVTGAGDLTGRISTGGALHLRNNNSTAESKSGPGLTTGNWYQIVYTLERTHIQDTFNATLEIFNSSNTGVVGNLVDSLSATGIINSTLWGQENLTPIIRDNSTISAFDNYQVMTIPEPSTLILALLAGTVGIITLRRKS